MKHITLFMLLLCGCIMTAQITITGTVRDTSGEPVPFVNITETGTQNGVTTSLNGTYSIAVQENATLAFSFVGYQTQRITVTQSQTLDVVLEEGDSLDQIVVTALGVKRKERELGYAVQTLDSKEIEEVKAVNLLDNLAGKVAGVSITPGATGVGSSSLITIRGEASFSNNNPLFIVEKLEMVVNSKD